MKTLSFVTTEKVLLAQSDQSFKTNILKILSQSKKEIIDVQTLMQTLVTSSKAEPGTFTAVITKQFEGVIEEDFSEVLNSISSLRGPEQNRIIGTLRDMEIELGGGPLAHTVEAIKCKLSECAARPPEGRAASNNSPSTVVVINNMQVKVQHLFNTSIDVENLLQGKTKHLQAMSFELMAGLNDLDSLIKERDAVIEELEAQVATASKRVEKKTIPLVNVNVQEFKRLKALANLCLKIKDPPKVFEFPFGEKEVPDDTEVDPENLKSFRNQVFILMSNTLRLKDEDLRSLTNYWNKRCIIPDGEPYNEKWRMPIATFGIEKRIEEADEAATVRPTSILSRGVETPTIVKFSDYINHIFRAEMTTKNRNEFSKSLGAYNRIVSEKADVPMTGDGGGARGTTFSGGDGE